MQGWLYKWSAIINLEELVAVTEFIAQGITINSLFFLDLLNKLKSKQSNGRIKISFKLYLFK